MLDTKKLLATAGRFAKTRADFTTDELLIAMRRKVTSQAQRHARDILRSAGWSTVTKRRRGQRGTIKAWIVPPPADEASGILSADQQAQVERDASVFVAAGERRYAPILDASAKITVTIAGPQGCGKSRLRSMIEARVGTSFRLPFQTAPVPIEFIETQTDGTTSDALDAETLLPAITEQLQLSIATNEQLVRQLREEREITQALNHYASDITERWQAALCAGGIITAFQVQARAEKEIGRLSVTLQQIRAHHGHQRSQSEQNGEGIWDGSLEPDEKLINRAGRIL